MRLKKWKIRHDVIFVSKETDKTYDKLICKHMDDIIDKFKDEKLRFVYLPEVLDFNFPGKRSNVSEIYTTLINRYNAEVTKRGLIFVDKWNGKTYYELEGETEEDLNKELNSILHPGEDINIIYESVCYDIPFELEKDNCYKKAAIEGTQFSISPLRKIDNVKADLSELFADKRKESEIKYEEIELSREIKEKIDRLKKLGWDYSKLLSLIEEKPKLSRMIITEKYHILLPDYNNMEIDMRPTAKALYILFLKHPEGIVFKDLPDYKEELMKIYSKVSTLSSKEAQEASIEAVVNPLMNTINVNCSRIKEAFYEKFTEELAKNYVITGKRGEAKKVNVDCRMIEWQCNI